METCSSLKIPSKEFVVINYPLIIEDEVKALESLGGKNAISELLKHNASETLKKRIPLHLRPQMIYSKPCYAEHSEMKGVLIQMRQLRNKKTDEIKVVPEILGQVKSIYDFDYMTDFELNPHASINKTNNNCKVFYNNLVSIPLCMDVEECSIYMDSNDDMFLPPIFFTKFEKPADFRFVKQQQSDTVIVKKVSTNPEIDLHHKETSKITELFDKQPIWTSSSLFSALEEQNIDNRHRIIRIRRDVAIHLATGPWRRTWVKMGFDYETDPSTRMYQVIEFRGNPSHIDSVKKIIKNNHASFKIEKSIWRISERHLPSSINCFYQLCHIEIPEVVELIKSEPIPSEPNKEFGWFTSDISNKIRNIIQKFLADQISLHMKNKIS